jgi:hypothetical protein
MAVAAGKLGDRLSVPVQPQPTETVVDGLDGPVRGSRPVGVLDAEKELSAMVPGEKPVEKSRAGTAEVKETGG